MSKQRPPEPQPGQPQRPQAAAAEPRKAAKPKASPWPWGRFRRGLISVLVSLHLTAVFVAPWALGLSTQDLYFLPPRDAQGRTIPDEQIKPEQIHYLVPMLASALHRAFAHYCDLLYINSGYEYFTPDPVWNHVLEYEVYDAANQKIAEGRMPDTHYQWPRLFYHRHMMLIGQTMDMPNSEYFVGARLLEVHDGQRVHLRLKRHHLLTPNEVLAGKKLDDVSTYEVIFEGDQVRDRPKPPPLPKPPSDEPAAPENISVPEVGP